MCVVNNILDLYCSSGCIGTQSGNSMCRRTFCFHFNSTYMKKKMLQAAIVQQQVTPFRAVHQFTGYLYTSCIKSDIVAVGAVRDNTNPCRQGHAKPTKDLRVRICLRHLLNQSSSIVCTGGGVTSGAEEVPLSVLSRISLYSWHIAHRWQNKCVVKSPHGASCKVRTFVINNFGQGKEHIA